MLLVTGITGHSGRYFLQELIENKYKGTIRCIVRETSNTSVLDNSGLNIEKVVGDINDKELIDKVMNGVETVMHIYNIHHSPLIVKSAINNQVKRTILVHTTGIYSNFKDASQEYLKVEKEVIELTNNISCPTKITILRPTMIYGDICDSNMSKFIKMVDRLRLIPVINQGKSLLQPVNARDLGKAFFDVLMSPSNTTGKAYVLSGEQPVKMIDVFKVISKELNKRTFYISVPLRTGIFAAKVINAITIGKINYIEKVQRMGENRSYSHNDAKTDFGYSPMSFEEGIRIEVEQYLGAKDSE